MKKIITLLAISLLISCSPKTYTFNGKKVSEKKYIRLTNKKINQYVKKYKPRMMSDSLHNFWMEYDSTRFKK